MGVVISLLRGINVGGHHKIKMDALRALYESLDLREPQTYVQSGNVVFRTKERDLARLSKRIEDAIEGAYGFRPAVIHRTLAELRDAIGRNPFGGRRGIEPGKLLVTFLASEPSAEARKKAGQIEANPEEFRLSGREVYIYFPNGMGRSKFPWAAMDKLLGSTGTGRNWNTVMKLLDMGEKLESS